MSLFQDTMILNDSGDRMFGDLSYYECYSSSEYPLS
jgi:hypothetical protein